MLEVQSLAEPKVSVNYRAVKFSERFGYMYQSQGQRWDAFQMGNRQVAWTLQLSYYPLLRAVEKSAAQ